MDGATGLAPWQDGVLERLGKEVNIAEYNMYLVHNGAMLINFGQLAACTPREKDFVYGNLEPIEVQTVRSFNVPASYRAKRSHLKDPSHKAKTAHQSVDTADLGLSIEDLPKSEEERGMVLLEWKKKTYSHGGSSWKSRKKIWRFSSLFSAVDRWSFSNVPSMSEHLKSCTFYQREERREPVALACLQEVRERHGKLKHKR
ncbi:hypothetical protein CHARACLAT_020603 [Characodon lateralis]|uniref:F-box domain-containing protein n=1 Tax=Characodon lateralis TaxID=208331 RepID=A0ABU7F5P9_9TELE|nr:hypothetical protein [Characodon lateralis]